jgi:quinoprotein glucose dehydrogenase
MNSKAPMRGSDVFRRHAAAIWIASVAVMFIAIFGLRGRAAQERGAAPIWGYGGGPEQIRYSALTQVTTSNVGQLQVAWTYDTGEQGAMQTQPVIVDGMLYGYTPTHKTFALDAATGEVKWTFDSGLRGSGPNRGVMYWRSGQEARVFSAVATFVYALDAATGKPIPTFGASGRIDLRENLGRPPESQAGRLTSPGVIYRDLMIIGGRVGEGLPTSPGDIRAYDVRTGALRWSFHTIPHPGEPGYETWPAEAWTYSGGANSWPGMALDENRGIVYAPTGSAASDFYGADRLGNNLYANCLIALDAATGRRLWHYQFVHHDIWDRDLPSPPSLVTIRRNGRTIDAVAQATKQGYVFVFDRVTGEPVFPIEERPFPKSDVPGEVTSATQPLPALPKPFARQLLTADLLTSRTPEVRAWALEQFKTFQSEGQFIPFSVNKQTVVFPGFDGGAEWGGQAFDPATGLYYVNANDLAWTGGLTPAAPAAGAGAAARGSSLINNSYRFTGYRRFLDPEGYPATAPPWGTLSAINLNTGEYAWQTPLGEYPELVAQGLKNTGSENYGGPVVTAGGLVFIGATNNDRKLRAFDKTTGALLWETVMPGPGRATPAVYEVNGRQYIAIALGSAGGGRGAGTTTTTGKYIAFALRR